MTSDGCGSGSGDAVTDDERETLRRYQWRLQDLQSDRRRLAEDFEAGRITKGEYECQWEIINRQIDAVKTMYAEKRGTP